MRNRMASSTRPIGGVTVFEEDDNKSQRTDSDQDMEPQVPIGTSDNNSDQDMPLSCSITPELNPALANSASPINTSKNDEMDLIPDASNACFNIDLTEDSLVVDDVEAVPDDSDPPPTNSRSIQPTDKDILLILLCLLLFAFYAYLQEDMPHSNNIRGQPRRETLNESSAYSSVRPDLPRTEMDAELPVPGNNLHPVNGTANESYMASMLRQESRQQNYQNVVHMQHHAETCLIDKEQPDDGARSTEVTEVLPNSRTRPPETRPQGVPHGGGIGIPLINTCNMDQFLNGLHQIFRFPLFLQLLEELAGRFPDSYRHLWEAVLLCKKGRFAEAKFRLVPYVYDMLSSEGQRVMPLIERQLCHRSDTLCEGCHTSSLGLPVYNIPLGNFDPSTGFQEAFRSYFIQHGVCRREGCNGQTTSNAVFESGTPPLILAVNLISLRHRIPNSQVVNDREIVELFGERYMMFLFTFVRPGNEDLHILGHYMSRAFIPEGRTDSEGRPTGRWYYYPNNQEGDLEPWTTDPPETFPSYAFFIRLPAPSEAAPCTVQEEEETPHSEDNEDDG
ncbi:uncharacterized protein LOC110444142 isoform X2 [Mizuhopecten yessoensis]|uniref:uncharacterized protein LOC110444142 isoform X2 n=1 Tax=Mizuhopecten yessoensis TaxID=6573 RepID=UPI000B45DB9F|nr:uncharacterized protein LOC110444142 isoform X2 [Mizuhopecten yessoensis]